MSEATQPNNPVVTEVPQPQAEQQTETKPAENSSSSSQRSAMARAMSSLMTGIEKVGHKQDELLALMSKEWQLPSLPVSKKDAVVQLSFAVADSDGIIDQALINIPIVGARTPVGCKRVHVQMEESVTALFVRPLMDALATAVVRWCEQNEVPRLPSQLMIPGGSMPAPMEQGTEGKQRSDL